MKGGNLPRSKLSDTILKFNPGDNYNSMDNTEYKKIPLTLYNKQNKVEYI